MDHQNTDNFLARLWNWMGRHPLLSITFFLAAQTGCSVWSGELWYPDEVRHASILQNLLRSDQWLLLQMHGTFYVDKPPVYFWFQAVLARLFGTDGPPIFFLSVALSGLLFLFSTYAMARRIGGMGRPGSLLCALLLLTNCYFVDRCHMPRMDLMFGAFMNLGAVCLFMGWSRPGFQLWTVAGFALAALATLTKGPLGLIFPVLAGVAWLVWQKRARRLWNWDGVLGFALALLMVGAWVWSCSRIAGPGLLHEIFVNQIFHRAVNSPMFKEPLFYYCVLLGLNSCSCIT